MAHMGMSRVTIRHCTHGNETSQKTSWHTRRWAVSVTRMSRVSSFVRQENESCVTLKGINLSLFILMFLSHGITHNSSICFSSHYTHVFQIITHMVSMSSSDKAPTNKICRRAPLAWLWPKRSSHSCFPCRLMFFMPLHTFFHVITHMFFTSLHTCFSCHHIHVFHAITLIFSMLFSHVFHVITHIVS